MNILSTTDIILMLFGLANAVWIVILYILSLNTIEKTEISKKGETANDKK
ncbi:MULTISPECIES: hypothetical protein [Chryseobacterium]|nr:MULTISPECIES: hypothetical protein [Chryseobacterium]MDR6919786.1 hypothetical protein [Chryseobacterium sp. 2987]